MANEPTAPPSFHRKQFKGLTEGGLGPKKKKNKYKKFFKKGFTTRMMLSDNVHCHLEFLCMYTKK